MVIAEIDKVLTRKCSDFIDLTSQVTLTAVTTLDCYFQERMAEFDVGVERVRHLENEGDVLRRDTESRLYSEALIPESRGDLLGLIESTDDIIDQIKKVVLIFSVETPVIPTDFREDFRQLTATVAKAVDAVLLAFRLFFYEPQRIFFQLPEGYALEKVADKQAARLKQDIFLRSDLSLSQKLHLRYFAHNIDLIADKAENLADRLSIAAIKQTQ